MAESLKKYLEETTHKGFRSAPRYYKEGDHLTYFVKPTRCVSHRVNELLTVYVSVDDTSLVGCKVKGVSQLMKKLHQLHVVVSDGSITMGLLLVSLAAITKETDTKEPILELASKLNPGEIIPKSELPIAA